MTPVAGPATGGQHPRPCRGPVARAAAGVLTGGQPGSSLLLRVAYAVIVLVFELAVQAGGAGAFSGQVIF